MGGIAHTFDSGDVAGGAAIDSGPRDIGSSEELTVYVDNSAGTVTRIATIELLRDDGTVALTFTSAAVAIGAREAITIAPSATAKGTAGANGSVEPLPVVPTRKARVQLAAGGTGAGRITAVGRY